MTGAVEVLREADDSFVVGCFRTDCPDHGALGAPEPWVAECTSRSDAQKAAKRHRDWIRDQYQPRCPRCHQSIETTTPTTEEPA